MSKKSEKSEKVGKVRKSQKETRDGLNEETHGTGDQTFNSNNTDCEHSNVLHSNVFSGGIHF